MVLRRHADHKRRPCTHTLDHELGFATQKSGRCDLFRRAGGCFGACRRVPTTFILSRRAAALLMASALPIAGVVQQSPAEILESRTARCRSCHRRGFSNEALAKRDRVLPAQPSWLHLLPGTLPAARYRTLVSIWRVRSFWTALVPSARQFRRSSGGGGSVDRRRARWCGISGPVGIDVRPMEGRRLFGYRPYDRPQRLLGGERGVTADVRRRSQSTGSASAMCRLKLAKFSIVRMYAAAPESGRDLLPWE